MTMYGFSGSLRRMRSAPTGARSDFHADFNVMSEPPMDSKLCVICGILSYLLGALCAMSLSDRSQSGLACAATDPIRISHTLHTQSLTHRIKHTNSNHLNKRAQHTFKSHSTFETHLNKFRTLWYNTYSFYLFLALTTIQHTKHNESINCCWFTKQCAN